MLVMYVREDVTSLQCVSNFQVSLIFVCVCAHVHAILLYLSVSMSFFFNRITWIVNPSFSLLSFFTEVQEEELHQVIEDSLILDFIEPFYLIRWLLNFI